MFKKFINIFPLTLLCCSIITHAESVQTFNNINHLKVAHIWENGINVRAEKNTESNIIDILNAEQQVEVVAIYPGWAKVCIALDSYGYVNDQFLQYRDYAATASQEYYEPVYEDYSQELEYYNNTTQYVNQYYENTYYEQQPQQYYEEPIYYEENYSNDYQEQEIQYQQYQEQNYQENVQYQQEQIEESPSASNGKYLSDYAQQYIGNPYVYGGTSLTNGADCSGFTMSVLADNGITVNGRTAAEQAAGGTKISLDQAQAGDLIYYDNGNGVYHIAVYNGDGTVTHSSSSTTGVIISDMNYSGNAAGAVRYW